MKSKLKSSAPHQSPTDRKPAASTSDSGSTFQRYDLERVNSSEDEIRIGDIISLRVVGLDWRKPAGGFYVAPPSEGASSETPQGFAVFSEDQVTITDSGEPIVKLTPLADGELALPSLEIYLVEKGERKTKIAETQPQVIGKVARTLTQEEVQSGAKPAPPYGVLDLHWPTWIWLMLAALILFGLLGTGYAAFRIWKKRRGIQAVTLPPIVLPEDELALKELGEIERSQLLSQRRFKPYYFGVSESLKKYLGARYRFDAQERTSGEILEEMRSAGQVSADTLKKLEAIFESLDRVKFTDYVPEVSEGEGLLQDSRMWVRSTRRPPVQFAPNSITGTEDSRSSEVKP